MFCSTSIPIVYRLCCFLVSLCTFAVIIHKCTEFQDDWKVCCRFLLFSVVLLINLCHYFFFRQLLFWFTSIFTFHHTLSCFLYKKLLQGIINSKTDSFIIKVHSTKHSIMTISLAIIYLSRIVIITAVMNTKLLIVTTKVHFNIESTIEWFRIITVITSKDPVFVITVIDIIRVHTK